MVNGVTGLPDNSDMERVIRTQISYNRKLCDMPYKDKEVIKWLHY